MVISKFPANISIPRNDIGSPNATQKASLIFRKRERKIKTEVSRFLHFPVKGLFFASMQWNSLLTLLALSHY